MTKGVRGKAVDGQGGRGWPAALVEERQLSALKLNPDNPRRHTLEQIEQISRSLRRWGQTIPILIDEQDQIIAGHGRVRAALLMGWERMQVVIARGWSEDEQRAYMIADNELAARSSWDPALLRGELGKLRGNNFDVTLLAFKPEDLQRFTEDPAAKSGESETFTVKVCPECGSAKRLPKE